MLAQNNNDNIILIMSAFDSLVNVPVVIVSSAVGFKVCVITAGIKKYIIVQKYRKNSVA